MRDNDLMSGKKKATPKQYAFAVIIWYIIFAIMIIFHMSYLIPQMEKANEETSELIEETEGAYPSTVETDYVAGARFVYILSLICFGLLDGLCAVILWKARVPEEQMIMFGNLAEGYIAVRAFSLFIMTVLSIMIWIGSNQRFLIGLFYLIVPIFSLISLILILYFDKNFSRKKFESDYMYEV